MYRILHIPTALYVEWLEEAYFDNQLECSFETKEKAMKVLNQHMSYTIGTVGAGFIILWRSFESTPLDKKLLDHEFEIVG